MSRTFSAHRDTRDQQGSVLIVVLWICLGLVSVTVVFGHAMMMAFRGSDNQLAAVQAQAAIDGAVRYAAYLMENAEEPGHLPLPEDYSFEAVAVGEARFWFLGRQLDVTSVSEPVFGLTDEAAKLNLNTATQEVLEALPGMTAELAAAIVDWRDEDDEISSGGAESETYALRQPSYTAKNAPFETVEELALVNGATWALLYGEDANLNGVLDPNENDGAASPPEDDADGRLDPGLLEYVTVSSRQPNTLPDGTARIQVNGAADELGTLLTDTFGEDRSNEIRSRLGTTTNVRSLLEFFIRSGMTEEEFEQVAGQLSVSSDEFQAGLVNVNTASEEVLACLPGMDEATASQLVATRSQRAEPSTSVAWVAGALEESVAIAAGPYLTAESWQVTVDVAAVGRLGRGYRRELILLDVSGEAAEVIYRRDRSGLGWALGSAVLQDLAQETNRP